MKKNLLVLFLLTLLFLPMVVLAQANTADPVKKDEEANKIITAGEANLENPLKVKSPQELIGQIINSVLAIVGSIALLMFIWGGLLWMTAAGNDEKISQGKKTLTWATLGLVIIFSSYALITYLINNVIGAT